jgi:putative tryptophan/tyrosine transport system substrate-binding protein
MRRREFVAGLGSAAAWPLIARAQQLDRVQRIGVLMAFDETDPQGKARFSAFTQRLAELGWTEGRKLRMDVRWGADNVDRMRLFAKELVSLKPDVILATSTPVTAALQGETRTIPIVFANINDPVGSGFVASLPRPGGNLTGLINVEATMAGKRLQLLTEIAPGTKRVAIMFSPETALYVRSYFQPSFEAAAGLLQVEPIIAPVYSDAEIEMVITSLAREPGGSLITVPDNFVNSHRQTVISQAARNNIPAVYQISVFVRDGGLLSYGVDDVDAYRRAATVVERILRGEKPSDLPVQLPAKFEMAINLKTAKALGLTIPETLLATADEVIQ